MEGPTKASAASSFAAGESGPYTLSAASHTCRVYPISGHSIEMCFKTLGVYAPRVNALLKTCRERSQSSTSVACDAHHQTPPAVPTTPLHGPNRRVKNRLNLLTGHIWIQGSHLSGYISLLRSHMQRKPHPISPSAISDGPRLVCWAWFDSETSRRRPATGKRCLGIFKGVRSSACSSIRLQSRIQRFSDRI